MKIGLTCLIAIIGFFTACQEEGNESSLKATACFDYAPSTGIEVGSEITYTNCSENARTFAWDFGDGNISIEENPKHIYESGGEFFVKMIATNKSSADTITKTVTINQVVLTDNFILNNGKYFELSTGGFGTGIYDEGPNTYYFITLHSSTVTWNNEDIDLDNFSGKGNVVAIWFQNSGAISTGSYPVSEYSFIASDFDFDNQPDDYNDDYSGLGDNIKGVNSGTLEILNFSNPTKIKFTNDDFTVEFEGNISDLSASPENNNPIVKADSTYNVLVEEDIIYAEGLSHDGQSPTTVAIPQKLDVYSPDNSSESRPVYMFIHGGGFRGGSRKTKSIVAMGNYFASRGWVFVSIHYRTTKNLGTIHTGIVPQEWIDAFSNSPQILAMYTAQRDAKAAMRWIVANADTYNIDTDFITVGGGSAGAMTAIALGISEQEDFRDEISTTVDPTLLTTNLNETFKIRSIVDFWGNNTVLSLLESTYGHNRYDSNDPELFIAHGTKDKTVPFSSANDLIAIYNSIGVHAELVPLVDEGHAAWDVTVNGKSLSDLSFDFLVERQNLNVE